MKRVVFLFLALAAVSLSCNKHEVKELDKLGCTNKNSLNYDPSATIDDGSCVATSPKQFGLVVEYTATWCGPCGSWGSPKMHELHDLGDVIGIACHVDGDPMYNAGLYASLTSCRPTGGGIPSFWVGDVEDGGVGDMTTLKARDPEASTVCKGDRNGNTLTVRTATEFLKALSGDYFLSVFVLESGIPGTGDYTQNGTSDPDYEHDFVLRTTATGDNAYGEKIAAGSIAAGKLVNKTYTITLDPSWDKELSCAVVLWKYDAGSGMYSFVNAFENKLQ